MEGGCICMSVWELLRASGCHCQVCGAHSGGKERIRRFLQRGWQEVMGAPVAQWQKGWGGEIDLRSV